MTTAPDLTAIVVASSDFGQVRRTVRSLAAQSIADRIELILVAPHEGVRAAAEPEMRNFHSVRFVSRGPITNVDEAVAAELCNATAPLVAPIEDHAFADPDWAERCLAIWDGTAAGIGPAVVNGNPGSGLSWANLGVAYNPWGENRPRGPHEAAPIHNGVFRTQALKPYRDELPALWNREARILGRLKEDGHGFLFEPAAKMRHLNPSTLRSTAELRFNAGRLYGATRAEREGWSPLRRGIYAVLCPLIPVIRYRKMRGDVFSAIGRSEARTGPWLFLALCFDGLGEGAGYLRGAGRSRDRLATFEMDRAQHLNRRDRARFYPGAPP